MLLMSLKTDDPAEAWSRIHPELLRLDDGGRIDGAALNGILKAHCRSLKTEKETLHWAQENKLIMVHVGEVPTAYFLTDLGKAWKPA